MLDSIPAGFQPILCLMKSLPKNPSGHTVLCGWNLQTSSLLASLASAPAETRQSIVLINNLQIENLESLAKRFPDLGLFAVTGDFTDETILATAGLAAATRAIIVPDDSSLAGGDNRGPDERTILGALTIKSIQPAIHVSALIRKAENAVHLRHARVNTVLLQGEFSDMVLARSTSDPLLPDVLRTLLGPAGPGSLRQASIPAQFPGTTFGELSQFFQMHNAGILVGVVPKGDSSGLAELLDDSGSDTDSFIKRKFLEAELELNGGNAQAFRLNPGADFPIGPKDTALVIG